MGNNESSSSAPTFDMVHHAKWKSQSKCGHSESDIKVREVRWIRVPMSSDDTKNWVTAGRVTAGIFTLGLSEIAEKKDLTHECLEILTTCQQCEEKRRYTADIIRHRQKDFCCGYYSLEIDERRSAKPSYMTLEYVRRKYNEMDDSYDVITNNCYHWSKRLWEKLF